MGPGASKKLVCAALLVALVGGSGCAARRAFRQGQQEAKKGNWDVAVARLTKALEKAPDNIGYKLALENARVHASRYHYEEARKHLAADDLEHAADELQIAVGYDASNAVAHDELVEVRERILKREEERRARADFEEAQARGRAVRYPVPVLAPRSPVPITLQFPDQSLEKIFEALSKLSGVNILLDESFRDKRVSVKLSGVTFQEALDQISLANHLFYKVLDQNTLIIVPEAPANRRKYDDQLVQTFYLESADATETLALVKAITQIKKGAANKALGALTLVGTPDQLAAAARVIETNDKALAEVVVEVEILQIRSQQLKDYGIRLSNYEAAATLAPTGAEDEVAGGFTTARAHLLSSLNLADFVVNIPSTLRAKFFQTDSTVRILAAPRLRAAEGQKTSLKIGTEVPIPVTTFATGGATGFNYQPATSFQYRNVGVNLDLTPSVTASGEITLEIVAEFSLLGEDRAIGAGENPLVVPTFLTQNLTGVLRLRDGQTSLLGGLRQVRDSQSFSGALGLRSIPILNKLFNATQDEEEDTEVLISITPHLVRAPKVRAQDLESLHIGTEEMLRVPGARPLFGQEEEAEPEPAAGAEGESPGPAAGGSETPPGMAQAPPGAPEEPASAAPAADLRARFSPRSLRLTAGESGALSLVVLGAKDLLGVELTLTYDGSLVEVAGIDPGSLLTLDGVAVASQRSIGATEARVRFARPSATAGSGAVVTLRLKGLREGTGAVSVGSLQVLTSGGQNVAAPGAAPAAVRVEP